MGCSILTESHKTRRRQRPEKTFDSKPCYCEEDDASKSIDKQGAVSTALVRVNAPTLKNGIISAPDPVAG